MNNKLKYLLTASNLAKRVGLSRERIRQLTHWKDKPLLQFVYQNGNRFIYSEKAVEYLNKKKEEFEK